MSSVETVVDSHVVASIGAEVSDVLDLGDVPDAFSHDPNVGSWGFVWSSPFITNVRMEVAGGTVVLVFDGFDIEICGSGGSLDGYGRCEGEEEDFFHCVLSLQGIVLLAMVRMEGWKCFESYFG